LKIFYSDRFVLPLPEGHRFPMRKYAMLRERVEAAGICSPGELRVPRPATDEELLRAHARGYLDRVKTGTLSRDEIRRIGFPWSEQMVERSRRSCGATLETSAAALEEGFAANLAGGTHHAFADRGEGYCVFNDVAVAIRALQHEGGIRHALIIDTDVHQGNGTASIFEGDPTVYTFSIHGAKNFPFHKEKSDLDVELPDGTEDGAYLDALAEGLERSLDESDAEIAFYLAGADAFSGDRLGRLSVSKEALAERDRMVLGACHERHLPVVLTMAGGYAREIEHTVEIHFNSIASAEKMWRLAREATRG